MDLDVTKAQCTSSHALKPDLLPQTPELEEQRLPPQDHLCVAFEGLLDSLGEMDQLFGKYENADSDDSNDEIDTVSNDADSAFNAPDALCRFQAPNAASFFDPLADAVVPYASFDQLLEIDDRLMQPPCVQQVSQDDIDDMDAMPQRTTMGPMNRSAKRCALTTMILLWILTVSMLFAISSQLHLLHNSPSMVS